MSFQVQGGQLLHANYRKGSKDPDQDQNVLSGSENKDQSQFSRYAVKSSGVTLAKFVNVTVDDEVVEKNYLIVTLIVSCLFKMGRSSRLE